MRVEDNASAPHRETLGLGLGLRGVLGFSLSLPATDVALRDLDPWFVGLGRAVVAAALAVLFILWQRAPLMPWRFVPQLAVAAGGVVIGFPLLSALALEHVPVAHGAVLSGIVPSLTAVFAVLRAGERPSKAFWAASCLGLAAVLAFAVTRGGGTIQLGDLLLLGAVAAVAVGYAEGAVLARTLGGPLVICYALLVSLPITVPLAIAGAVRGGLHAGSHEWLGFAYVAAISMFAAFFAWYEGLARGGVARVGQTQLLQPVLTLSWAILLLGEPLHASTVATAALVVVSAALVQRTRVRPIGHTPRGQLARSATVRPEWSPSPSTTRSTPASPTTPPRTPAPGGGTSSAPPSQAAS
jgi:drug/metabolite transporter (DMT)-like permease